MATGRADVVQFKSPPPETEDNRTFRDGADPDDANLACDEAALIQKIERRVEGPEDFKSEMSRWQELRNYVHTDAMLLDEEDAVGTNFLYRHQDALMALITPKDPAPRVLPRKWLPPMGAEGAPISYPPEVLQYAKTHEIILDRQQQQSHLDRVIEGAAQDAVTLPMAWVKMRMQEDFHLDPVGYGRHNDQLDSLKRYERLRMDFDAGVFTDRSAEFRELQQLSDTIKAFILEGMQAQIAETQELQFDEVTARPLLDDADQPVYSGAEDIQAEVDALLANPEALVDISQLPEIAHYIGFTFQQVDPEDIRWDWNIRRPEDLCYARWMAHRVWMTEADIREKWKVAPEELRTAARFTHDGYSITLKDSADDDPEYGGKDEEERERGFGETDDDQRRGETMAVWEYWDKVQGRVMRFVQGTGKFLDSYVPVAAPRRFFPFFLVSFNRATGRLWGVCDTDLQAPLQDESNRMRTWQREAQRNAHPRWMIAKGLLRPSEKRRFEDALPYSLTEVERAEDVAKGVFPIVPPDYNPALYDRTATIMEMQQMAGIPNAALGAGNPGLTATSDAISNQQMGNQIGRRQRVLERLYQDIYQAMMEMNAQVLPEENVAEIVGPGYVWPSLNKQQVLGAFFVEVESTLDDVQTRMQELKAWLDLSQIATSMGLPLHPIPVTKKLMELMGVRDNLGTFMNVMAMLPDGGMGQSSAGGGSAPAPASSPDAQGGRGVEGGAPAGEGLDGPPLPEGVPGPV